MLGVALRTVQLWVEKGNLAAWKTAGGHRRIVRNSVEALMALQRAAIEECNKDKQLTLLVVEDDPVYLEMYRIKVELWHPPVTMIAATDGFEGLLKIGEHKPDVVIVDLKMPGMDGFQMIRRLQDNLKSEDILIIVVTGLCEEDIAASGGIPDGIPKLEKPVSFEDLADLIQKRTRRAVYQT